MSTNSRAGRSSPSDQQAVYALALERAQAGELPTSPLQAPALDTRRLLCRLGKVRPLPSQVPPT